jgi:hypothetical protein
MSSCPGPLFEPRQTQLRARQRLAVEITGDELIDALLEDLASTNLLDTEICERSGTDRGHFSRVKAKQAHPSQALVAFAVDQSRHRPPRYLVAINALADYEPRPRPPPDVGAVLEAYRDELRSKFPELDDVLRGRVERRLGVVLSPSKTRGETP